MNTKRILVVDDDQDIRDGLQQILELEGYEVCLAEHGLEALNYLKSHKKNSPGMIFLDLRMPVMDGKTFLRTIRDENPEFLDIPIVVGSANLAFADPEILSAAVARLKKPMDIDDVYGLAAKYMRR